MYIRTSKKLILALAIAIMLNISSCKKYEEGPGFSLKSKIARLTGIWEVVEIDKIDMPVDEKMILEFEKEGDFKFTYEYSYYSYSYAYSYEGNWEWSSDKEALKIDMDGDIVEWEILKLTNKELWFVNESDQELQCEKNK
jgi:hypothetical protein